MLPNNVAFYRNHFIFIVLLKAAVLGWIWGGWRGIPAATDVVGVRRYPPTPPGLTYTSSSSKTKAKKLRNSMYLENFHSVWYRFFPLVCLFEDNGVPVCSLRRWAESKCIVPTRAWLHEPWLVSALCFSHRQEPCLRHLYQPSGWQWPGVGIFL